MSGEEEQVVELDFTNIDRVGQYMQSDAEEEAGEFELPIWHQSDEDMDELYSVESLTKAVDLVRGEKVKPMLGREGIYEVVGSDLYVCHIIELEGSKVPGITCTCPNGQNRAGRPTCYHSAAVLLVHTGADVDKFSLDFHL